MIKKKPYPSQLRLPYQTRNPSNEIGTTPQKTNKYEAQFSTNSILKDEIEKKTQKKDKKNSCKLGLTC